jgi:hypothetical protein
MREGRRVGEDERRVGDSNGMDASALSLTDQARRIWEEVDVAVGINELELGHVSHARIHIL